jgi:hypothetical protein
VYRVAVCLEGLGHGLAHVARADDADVMQFHVLSPVNGWSLRDALKYTPVVSPNKKIFIP